MPQLTSDDLVRMREGVLFEGPDMNRRIARFWLLLPLSAVIASAGIVADSTATVIGAMIVAPLMVPILGTVLAVVLADRDNLLRCLGLLAAGAASVIVIGYLIGAATDIPVTEATNSQVAGRVHPRLIDLIAALATGAVGSIALARRDIADTLPGVAIAISLVPPLAVVGLTLEAGEGEQALGAMLLFATNVSAIWATGLVIMGIYKVASLATTEAGVRTVDRRRAAAAIAAGLVVIAIPLSATSAQIARSTATEAQVADLAGAWADDSGWQIISVSTTSTGVTVRATGPLPEPDTEDLRRALDDSDLPDLDISVLLVPSTTVELDGAD